MAYSYFDYEGTGTTIQTNILCVSTEHMYAFKVLSEDESNVTLSDVALEATFTKSNAGVLCELGTAPSTKIRIIRSTPYDVLMHDFSNGAQFNAFSVDEVYEQVLYLCQELVEGKLIIDSSGNFGGTRAGISPQELQAQLAAQYSMGYSAGLAQQGKVLGQPLNVTDFPSLQSAIDEAVVSGRVLEGNPGETYVVTEPLTANGALRFDLRGAVIDGSAVPAGTTFNERPVLKVSGSIGAGVLLTSDVTPVGGVQNITIASTAGLAAGDYLLLSSNQLMVDGYGNAGSLRGEIIRVNAVINATTIQSASGVLFSYTTAAAAKVQKITNADRVQISNGKIICGGVGSWHTGLQLNYCTDFKVENLSTVGGEDVGITTFYCAGGLVRGGTQENCTNPDGGLQNNSGSGYGICLYYASRDIVIDGVKFRNCKRAVTGGALYPAVFNTIRNCVAEGGRNGLGTHEPCWWWTIEDNVISGMTGVGINVRGQFNKIHRNKIFNTDSFGIQVRTFYVNPLGLRGVEILDNYLERTSGIFLDGHATNGRVIDATIRGGEIRNAEFNNITVRRSDNVIIDGVRITGQVVPGVTDGNGIVFSGSATAGDNCTNVLINGVEIKDAARYGILALRVKKLQILNSKVHLAQREAFRADTCEDSIIAGNRVKGAVVNFTYSILAINCLKTAVNNNHVEGGNNAVQTGNHGIGFVASSGVCEDNQAVGNTISGHASAVIVTGTGVNHSVVVGNNGRNCYGATKFNITSANQSVANNLI